MAAVIDPASKTPEEWEAEAIHLEAEAIAEQPDPDGDVARRRAIGRLVHEMHGDHPPVAAWYEHNPELQAIRSRHYAAERRRQLAADCRNNAVLSGIARASASRDVGGTFSKPLPPPEPNDGPGPDGHHVVTGECFACLVGVATGPESHGDRCPARRPR